MKRIEEYNRNQFELIRGRLCPICGHEVEMDNHYFFRFREGVLFYAHQDCFAGLLGFLASKYNKKAIEHLAKTRLEMERNEGDVKGEKTDEQVQ